MSRLIDADDLIEYIKIWEIGNSISSDQKEFIDCVNNQPTVFDVDKVVEQIESRRAFFDCRSCKYRDTNDQMCDKDCSDALIDSLVEIVKGGGVDGN